MKQYNDMIPGAKLRRRKNFNSVTETGISPDELGVSITKSVFGWKTAPSGMKAANGADIGTNTAAQQAIDTYGMPFIFVIGGNQILLPPAVMSGGTPVPPIPDGLTVVWAPSFMGVAIPPDMLTPVAMGGRLLFSADSMQSAANIVPAANVNTGNFLSNISANLAAQAGTAATLYQKTTALLTGNGNTTGPNGGQTLVLLLMSAMECLIYSYSSYPWGNQYQDLHDTVINNRDLSNWLIYPYQKGTVLSNVLNAVAPVYTKYIAPVLGIAATVVAPGVGTALVAGSAAALNAAKNASNAGSGQPQLVNGQEGTTIIPAGTLVQDQGGVVVSSGSGASGLLSSPLLIIAIIILIIFLIM